MSDYSINFLNLVVLQYDAMNVFSHTGVLKNPEHSGQALMSETLFILAFLLNIETIFRNYVGYEAALQVYLQKTDRYPK